MNICINIHNVTIITLSKNSDNNSTVYIIYIHIIHTEFHFFSHPFLLAGTVFPPDFMAIRALHPGGFRSPPREP